MLDSDTVNMRLAKKNTFYAVKYHKIFLRFKKKNILSMFFGGGSECTALSIYHD